MAKAPEGWFEVERLGGTGILINPRTKQREFFTEVHWKPTLILNDNLDCPNLTPSVWGFERSGGELPEFSEQAARRKKRGTIEEHPCPLCNYVFTRRDTMVRHLRSRCKAPGAPNHPHPCPPDCEQPCFGQQPFVPPPEAPRGRRPRNNLSNNNNDNNN